MSQAAAISGNQNLQANANVEEGTRQFTAFTNILNANRDQSLRERQFAQQMLNQDREFQLAKNAQEYNFQMGNREFDLKKNYQDVLANASKIQADSALFNLETSKMLLNQQKEAQAKRPELYKAIADYLGPKGGYSPDGLQKVLEIKAKIATNPALAKEFDDVASGFVRDANLYNEQNIGALMGQAQGALISGKLDKILVDDIDNPGKQVNGRWLLYQAQQAGSNGDIIGTLGALNALKSGLDTYDARVLRDINKQLADEAAQAGLPPKDIKIEKGQTTYEFGLTRGVNTGGTGAGGSVGRPVTSEMTNPLKDFENKLESARGDLEKATTALKEVSDNPTSPEAAKRNKDYQDALERFDTAKNLRDSQERAILIQNEAVGQPRAVSTKQTPQYGVPFGTQQAQPIVPSVGAPTPAQNLQAPQSARSLFAPKPAPAIESVMPQAKPQTGVETVPATNVFAPESLLSPEAQAVVGAGRTAQKAVTAGTLNVAQNLPVVGPMVKGIQTAIPVAKATAKVAKVGGRVAKELLSYEDFLSKTEAAARARAESGEDYQTALQDEQKKLFESIKASREPGRVSQL